MATTKGQKTKNDAKGPKHCWNCGQKVTGKVAEFAAKLGVAFCCYCGTRLGSDGNCENEACPYCGQAPVC